MPRRKIPKPLPKSTPAPGFSLEDAPGHLVSVTDYSGLPLIILFYQADFNPLCTQELTLFNEALPEFYSRGAQVIAISTDSVWSHMAFADDFNLHFPLLSDHHPKGWVAESYGMYDDREGHPVRSIYVLDKHSVVVWNLIPPPGITPDARGALEAVEGL